jgi:UDP-glucose 4-epimerase
MGEESFMNITILGAAGFIGTNLTLKLAKNPENNIQVVDEHYEYFNDCVDLCNVREKELAFDIQSDFSEVLKDQEQVYHLISTNNPTSSNKDIGQEITDNISISINILEACVKNRVKKIIFISSGGTVYGNATHYPICEDDITQPITTYGIQKLTIEKLLYLYHYVHGLDYGVIRLSNPYGPYQRPNGKLGVVTTFAYKALKREKLVVYGDGSVVRDYVFIDDAVEAIVNVANSEAKYKIFNFGSGVGTSIKDIIAILERTLGYAIDVEYREKRSVDVPVNYLDISRYKSVFGENQVTSLDEGIGKTLNFIKYTQRMVSG